MPCRRVMGLGYRRRSCAFMHGHSAMLRRLTSHPVPLFLSPFTTHARTLVTPARPLPPTPPGQVLTASRQAHREEEVLEIAIKPGWKKGTRITFKEKGE